MQHWQPIEGVTIIGLGHKARHGKDSAARILIEAFPRDVQRFAFADDLKAVARVMFGMREKDGPLLQTLGADVIRRNDPDAWLRSVYYKIAETRPAVAVITDVRFPNELEFVRASGGECWRVERRLPDGSLFVDPSRPATHSSETALDGAAWDRVLVNPEGRPDVFKGAVMAAYCALRFGGKPETRELEHGEGFGVVRTVGKMGAR
jgi:hypothetical protein